MILSSKQLSDMRWAQASLEAKLVRLSIASDPIPSGWRQYNLLGGGNCEIASNSGSGHTSFRIVECRFGFCSNGRSFWVEEVSGAGSCCSGRFSESDAVF